MTVASTAVRPSPPPSRGTAHASETKKPRSLAVCTRDTATYACPCVHDASRKSKSARVSVWPCERLIVSALAVRAQVGWRRDALSYSPSLLSELTWVAHR